MSDAKSARMFITAKCPSCETSSRFQNIGVQKWQADVAAQLNVPSEYTVYRCQNCDTCINEFALDDDSATVG